MRANKIQVNQRIYVKDFIGDPDKMAGSHFSGWTKYINQAGKKHLMTDINSGRPIQEKGITTPEQGRSNPSGEVSARDSEQFSNQMENENHNNTETAAETEEELVTPEEQLRELMQKQAVREHSERQKEMVEEMKKNFE